MDNVPPSALFAFVICKNDGVIVSKIKFVAHIDTHVFAGTLTAGAGAAPGGVVAWLMTWFTSGAAS